MTRITVIWSMWHDDSALCAEMRANGRNPMAERSIELEDWLVVDDLSLCEALFTQTNIYEGALWDRMQPLPEDRTHTALSPGDFVVVDGRSYRCDRVGWTLAERPT
jgi:hypothetical protein